MVGLRCHVRPHVLHVCVSISPSLVILRGYHTEVFGGGGEAHGAPLNLCRGVGPPQPELPGGGAVRLLSPAPRGQAEAGVPLLSTRGKPELEAANAAIGVQRTGRG